MSPAPTSNRKNRRKFSPLPFGAEDDNMFCGVFIPTYERWVRTQANPWVIPDDIAIKTLQVIWDSIYLAMPWTVKANNCVFEHVHFSIFFTFKKGRGQMSSNSRSSLGCAAPLKWCSSFKSAADIMLKQFFNHKSNCVIFEDYNTHKMWVEDMLDGCNFVWVMPDDVGFSNVSGSLLLTSTLPQELWSGLMHAPFILQVFATHLNSIVGAEEVLELKVTSNHEGVSIVVRYPPIGALAIAAATVSTLSLYTNEADTLRLSEFSNSGLTVRWGPGPSMMNK
jgi:hypothetical protein